MTPDEIHKLLEHLPHNGWELVGLLALLAFLGQAVGGTAILRWHRNRNAEAAADRAAATQDRAELKASTEAIKSQVVNGHTEPMRADLDRVLADGQNLRLEFQELRSEFRQIMSIVRALPDELRGLRQDIEAANAARRDLAADVRADMGEIRKRYGRAIE